MIKAIINWFMSYRGRQFKPNNDQRLIMAARIRRKTFIKQAEEHFKKEGK